MIRFIYNQKAIFLYSLLVLIIGCKKSSDYHEIASIDTLDKYLKSCIVNTVTALENLEKTTSTEERKEYFLEARMHFKACEPILAFIDSENYGYLNQPNILKVEEEDFTDIKIKQPTGFQVIEELLYAEEVDVKELKIHIENTTNRLNFLNKNLTLKFLKNHHVLWMLRDEINRISITGVTGFDSPVLENSLQESQAAFRSINKIITIFKDDFTDVNLYNKWQKQITESISFLGKTSFNNFDRYSFIKNHTNNLLAVWTQTVSDWKIKFPFEQPINYNATNLFSNTTFNLHHFTDQKGNPIQEDKVKLGKLLFEDKNLSEKKNMSCASCHQEELFFTDGKPKSTGATRNSPTLFYAGLQKSFFYDKRSGSLEAQIIDVIGNPNEFHLTLNILEKRVIEKKQYQKMFQDIYSKKIDNELIRSAIASYILSLNPFNSKFDRNMQGKEKTLTEGELYGFNLFMGKAKCATCHFAPIFNGLVPTSFKESEMELIGVPKTKDTLHPIIDDDLGRYNMYKTKQRSYFFKTPSVRNIQKTGPYMHNGVYTTLAEVIDFYNKGGGNGLGLDLEYQTLPPAKLNLTSKEKRALELFLISLTDQK
jgi:cytochrome c peroxidase